jgi:hypothetical protein
MIRLHLACALILSAIAVPTQAQVPAPAKTTLQLGPYEYETKPDHAVFKSFNPRKSPPPGSLLIREGDRLAICGDSITEQKRYSRIIETQSKSRKSSMAAREKQILRQQLLAAKRNAGRWRMPFSDAMATIDHTIEIMPLDP